jgi:hypothetical protein
MEELQRHQVCRVHAATNQHDSGQIEICDEFWPYEKPRIEGAQKGLESYVAQVRHLFGSRRCVSKSFSATDEVLAKALFQRGVPFQQVERGFFLGCARKYTSLLDNTNHKLIVSFGYFRDTIEEAGMYLRWEDYWHYVQYSLERMETRWLARSLEGNEQPGQVMR